MGMMRNVPNGFKANLQNKNEIDKIKGFSLKIGEILLFLQDYNIGLQWPSQKSLKFFS
ncbi:MAG: hypothetical protein FMNOHCHN_01130 [Ignavibacteriaceae bacterium]|nr:hypothetical protein [Ignavibacteriaceae bacterium]